MIFQMSVDVSDLLLNQYIGQGLLLTDAPGVVDCVVDTPLGNSDHSSISVTLQLGFCIPSITFLSQIFLKSRVDWSRIHQDLQEFTWGNVYNRPDSVNAYNNLLISIISKRVLIKIKIRQLTDKA